MNLYLTLRGMFRTERDVQLSVDRQNNAIVAFATPEDHVKIEELIKSVEAAGAAGRGETLEFYSVKDMDTNALVGVIEELVEEKGGRVNLSLAPRTEQLVVMARPEMHELVVKTLEGFQVEERVLEVYQLELVDPLTAQMASSTLYGFDSTARPPIIDADTATQRLYVRATQKQHEELRELLVKMGEESLQIRRGTEEGIGRLRTISFDGDAMQALEQIQRIWPQLRKNPIHVVKPPNVLEQQRQPAEKEKGDEKTPEEPGPSSDASDKADAPGGDGQSNAAPLDFENALVEVGMPDTGFVLGLVQSDAAATPAVKAAAETAPNVVTPKAVAAPDTEADPSASLSESPIVVIPGHDSVTIACDDPEALEQFESLLRALSRRMGTIGRNLIVIPLRNVTAATVADTLNHLFRETSIGSAVGTGPVTIVPDERLNAIIVHANRADRATIRSLAEVLDTAEIPDSLAIKRPKLIPVKNTDAERIEDVLESVYKTHMSTQGMSRPIPIPRGIPSQLAGALQQINAATAGPLLTVDVEEKSNSLVVMAPTALLEEIESLVAELDQAALKDRSRRVTLIQLKKTKSSRVQQALDMLTSGSRSRSSSRRGR